MLQRYPDAQRMNHWLIALLFFGAGLSGLAFFHPSLFFLSNLFGGGPWARILHPYMGLLMVLAFAVLAVQLWKENRWTKTDTEWVRHSKDMLAGDKSNMPPAGKYNAGQKGIFWLMVVCLAVLLVTGVMFWHAWFPEGNILMRRVAVLLHAAAATGLILGVIVHIYAAIWVKGTIRAMTRGTVTETWAKHNHPLWYKEVKERPRA
ncbi:formate dehydrogenase subunit gamma [Roseateles terrae]|uniref:Formate dehydrogenase subunit gamma n=1 Tax=Roseateles terrae TaxID=431060 RepID=A0ABR6GPK3_9BURK|nr:formate dehydrogenase subunit gamma [Roseateles terrae]MBB3194055.1 formate dehydrogenase subunit gamma [Roseateles terrae]OWQ87921.1 formate dehydrogenase subunit gamma [Roseateles terrae]